LNRFKYLLFFIIIQLSGLVVPTLAQQGISFTGTPFQHYLVDETIKVFDEVVAQDLSGNLRDAIVKFANLSIAVNKVEDLVTTLAILDLCWEMLDFTRKTVLYGHSKNFSLLGLMQEDINTLSSSTISSTQYSAEIAKDVAISFVTVGYYAGRLAIVLDQHNMFYSFKKCPDMEELWASGQSYEHSKALAEEKLNNPANAPYVELLNTINSVISLVPKEYAPNFLSCMKKGRVFSSIEITAQDVVKYCAEEISLLMKKMNNK
jgi:hypothetical protein